LDLTLDRGRVQRLVFLGQFGLDGLGNGSSVGEDSGVGRGRSVVFLDCLGPDPGLGDQFLLGPEVVGQQSLQGPDPVQQVQLCWCVVAVVAHGLTHALCQFFCSTCAPSFLLPDLDLVKVRFSAWHQRNSSQLMNSDPLSLSIPLMALRS
jgi:hypothetical protein